MDNKVYVNIMEKMVFRPVRIKPLYIIKIHVMMGTCINVAEYNTLNVQ